MNFEESIQEHADRLVRRRAVIRKIHLEEVADLRRDNEMIHLREERIAAMKEEMDEISREILAIRGQA